MDDLGSISFSVFRITAKCLKNASSWVPHDSFRELVDLADAMVCLNDHDKWYLWMSGGI